MSAAKRNGAEWVNNDEIEKTLLDWFRKARSKNIPVTGPMPQEKARRIADALSLSQEDFKTSNWWLDRFKNRNGIKAKCISGETGDMNEDTVDSWRERHPDILQGWVPENIWNMNETAQFFRVLSSHVVARAERDPKSVWHVLFLWMARRSGRQILAN